MRINRNEMLSLIDKKNQGISMYDLSEISNKYGLHSIGVKGNVLDLYEKFPCIAHIVKNDFYHYMVIFGINNNVVTLLDPSIGIVKMNLQDFLNISTGVFLIFENKKFDMNKDNRFRNILFKIFKLNKKIIIKCVAFSILFSIFTLIFNYYLIVILSTYKISFKLSLIILIVFINVVLLKTFFQFIKNKFLIIINNNIDEIVMNKVIRKIIYLPYDYFIERSTGEITTIINDIDNFKDIIIKVFISSILDMLFVFLILLYIGFINIVFLIIFIVIGIIVFIVSKKFQSIFSNNYQCLKQSKIMASSYVYDALCSFDSIKNLNIEEKVILKINDNYKQVIKNNKKYLRCYFNYEILNGLIIDLFYLLLIFCCLMFLIITKQNSINIVLFSSVFYLLIGFVSNVCECYSMKKVYYNSISRVLDVIELLPEKFNKSKSYNINKISFRNVCYSKHNFCILKNINLDINKCDRIFIKGESGIGKSTLMRLLLKYFKSTSGKILINGISINNIDLSYIRKCITYVCQNEMLFSTSINENMKIVNDDVDLIKKACNTALVPQIFNNDDYLNIILEENGLNLSGGERKKIIVARALLKTDQVLILDECFNEISINEERVILNNIFTNYPNLTIILISHRDNNIDLFNKVYELKGEMNEENK